MNYKKSFITALTLAAIPCLCFFIILGIVLFTQGPFQLQKKTSYDVDRFFIYKNMRLQARSIINNINFDSVILGTSMLENTSSFEASKALGGTFFNLSLNGSNFYERSIILEYLFQNKKIKNILYSLERIYVHQNTIINQHDHWQLLYDNNIFNDIYALYNKKWIQKIFERAIAPSKSTFVDKKYHDKFYDKPMEWMSNPYYNCRFGGLQNWVQNLEKQGMANFLLKILPQYSHSKGSLQYPPIKADNILKAQQYIDTYILRFVKEHPETTFYLIFTPYYRLQYAMWLQEKGNKYQTHQAVIKYLAQKSAKYKNLFIYGFEDQDFLDSIENYRDTSHYHADINSYITQSISKGKHQLTPQNVDAYLAKCEQLALAFDIRKLYEDSQKLLRHYNKPTVWEEYGAWRKKHRESNKKK